MCLSKQDCLNCGVKNDREWKRSDKLCRDNSVTPVWQIGRRSVVSLCSEFAPTPSILLSRLPLFGKIVL
jgi:hypothetical protein